MLHHYPQIPQQIISIPNSLYTQSPHNQTQPSPPTVPVSYLSPATSLYATLLQSLSIKLLQSFPHAAPLHQYPIPTSTFGLTHLYPPHPLFVLTQSVPHAHLRPAHIFLPAPSQHALHEFSAQSELLLPCGGGGRIELNEFGERCCVRDLDGNLIEVHWSNQYPERGKGYFIPDAATQISHSQRGRGKSLEFSSYRERNRERGRDKEMTILAEDRQIRHSSKNQAIAPDNMALDSGRKPNVKNRRVLQWQKDVAKSINVQDEDSYSEEYEMSNEFNSSEEDEHHLSHARSYTQSHVDYVTRPSRNKPPSAYQDVYAIDDKYQIVKGSRGDYNYQKPYKHRNETKSKNREGRITRLQVTSNKKDRKRTDLRSESSSCSPINQSRHSHYTSNTPSKLSTNYNSRTGRARRTESDQIVLNNSGRRDSGIGGIGGYSDDEEYCEEFETRSKHKYKGRASIASKTHKESRTRYSPKITSEPYDRDEIHGHSIERNGKKVSRRSRPSFRQQTSSYSSLSESDAESYKTKSSKSDYYKKNESSRISKEREKEKRRKWIEERDLVRDLHRKQIGRELADKPRQKVRRNNKSHHSPVRSAALQSPISVSGSTKRGKRQILARVPKPPSAVPIQTRERSETLENESFDDYDEISDGFEETDSEYDFPMTAKKSHRPTSTHHTSSQSNFDGRRRRAGSFNYSSEGKRELKAPYNRSRHGYANSVAISDSSSFHKDREYTQKDNRRKSRRRKSSVRF